MLLSIVAKNNKHASLAVSFNGTITEALDFFLKKPMFSNGDIRLKEMTISETKVEAGT